MQEIPEAAMPDCVQHHPTPPQLIADVAALDGYLAEFPSRTYATSDVPGGVDLQAWLATGDDACERCWLHARRLAVPLVRLPEVEADPAIAGLLAPDQARRFRVVPLRSANGLLAVAMEDPADSQALSAVEFVTSDRVLPLMATARGIREAKPTPCIGSRSRKACARSLPPPSRWRGPGRFRWPRRGGCARTERPALPGTEKKKGPQAGPSSNRVMPDQ